MRPLTASYDSWAAQHSLYWNNLPILVLIHQSITLSKIAIYSFHTDIYQRSINPLQWSAAPSQPNPAPDPLLSSATALGVSCYYAWGSRKKSFSPSVSVSDSLPVSKPGLLTSAILAEILYMPFTVGEQFSLRNAQLYEIKPHFHY